ncbi:MAG: hypothetical protein A3J74_03065 [Elusimicrobia bacterium RIFCSPHIGHO2_02_FULL_57_9]|nr:MAG: hypothetical protein A3J74_03065 [Elusimicrobia bacterium RIFCSPHIGHO2_02_FULL_57_9]
MSKIAERLAVEKTTHINIAYPIEGEIVSSPHYTFQIGTAPEAMRVAVSIDGGEWQPCREALGLWWHDWQDYQPGRHQIQVRIEKERGRMEISPIRRFLVQF